MIYLLDTHVLIWFLTGDKKLKPRHREILSNQNHRFLVSTIVLAELKYLDAAKRIPLNFGLVLKLLTKSKNCVILPVDQEVIAQMPLGLNIHDALIVGSGIAYHHATKNDLQVVTEDHEIIRSKLIPVA